MQVAARRGKRSVNVGMSVHPDQTDRRLISQGASSSVYTADSQWVITTEYKWQIAFLDCIANFLR